MKISEILLDFFFPPSCICCKRAINPRSPLPFCDECFSLLPTYKMDEPKVIEDTNITRCYCLYQYSKYDVKGIVFHTKNIFSFRYADFISDEMKRSLISHNLHNKIDIITYCPRKINTVRRIGFDQAEELAKALSKKIKRPYENLIIRKGKSSEQKFLSFKDRYANVKNIFFFNDKKNIKDKVILLVDDVVTTGATVRACAKVLKDNGARAVFVLAVAD